MNKWSKQLYKYLGTPPKHGRCDESQLEATQNLIGTSLPDDFLDFVRKYGPGRISLQFYSYMIYSPFLSRYVDIVRTEYFDFNPSLHRHCEPANCEVSMTIFPDEGGFLIFGSGNDPKLGWKTVGDPNEWPVVFLWDYFVGFNTVFEMTFAEFFVKLIRREINLYSEQEWTPDNVTFVSDERF